MSGVASSESASGVASGETASGDDDGNDDLSSGNFGSGAYEPPSAPSPPPECRNYPPSPPPQKTIQQRAFIAADEAPAVFTIAQASAGATHLLVDAATPLAQVPAPYLIRIAVGLPQQEDLAVVGTMALHGSNGTAAAADGRFELTLGEALRFTHAHGEPLRIVDRQAVLRTRFLVYTGGEASQTIDETSSTRLFDAHISGPDAPHLHDDFQTLDLQLANLSAMGHHALRRHDPTVSARLGIAYRHHDYGSLLDHTQQEQLAAHHAQPLMLAASAAVKGWAAFGFEPSIVAAATVAIRFTSFRRRSNHGHSRGASHGGGGGKGGGGGNGGGGGGGDNRMGQLTLTRGGASLGRPSKPLRPLVGAIDLSASRAYFSNVSESGSGWVATMRLADFPRSARPRQGGYGMESNLPDSTDGGPQPPLTAAERSLLGVGPVASRFGSPLYARFTPTSELGMELPYDDGGRAGVAGRGASGGGVGDGGSLATGVDASGAVGERVLDASEAGAESEAGKRELGEPVVGSASLVLVEYEIVGNEYSV